jgi:hypothetical protein
MKIGLIIILYSVASIAILLPITLLDVHPALCFSAGFWFAFTLYVLLTYLEIK